MRLFIAINFDKNFKDGLINTREELRNQSVFGNFTSGENLHLTLAFIGETKNMQGAKKAVDRDFENFKGFKITSEKFGKFSDLWWVGIKENTSLTTAAENIQKELIASGYNIEKRKFKPHITIARQVVSKEKIFITPPHLTMNVSRISLMQSSRISGKLCYTEIYGKDLL